MKHKKTVDKKGTMYLAEPDSQKGPHVVNQIHPNPPLPKETLIERYGGPAPRYTSYPTAPHFSDDVGEAALRQRLRDLPSEQAISLYIHIPYCDTLCWFCGCHTKITQRYKPVGGYVDTLIKEMRLLSDALARKHALSHMHWGGGSPTLLTPEDSLRLAQEAFTLFPAEDKYEFAVEIDPRDTGPDRIAALAQAGLTRASIGIQDFDPLVQKTINRMQGFEETKAAVDALRDNGVNSINFDLMYGLPYQTLERTLATVHQAISLRPDRVALFGYAHVPWMKTHQRMIPDEALPSGAERLEAAEASAEFLLASGYERIGIDHFALPHDSMAKSLNNGSLKRSFQGYTTDQAPAMLSVGASAIGHFPDLYFQNEPSLKSYALAIEEGRLPIVRGIELSTDDRRRRTIIERLMCDFACDLRDTPIPDGLAQMAMDGLIKLQGKHLTVLPAGRPYVRQVAACFDAYLSRGAARHSSTV